MELYLASKDDLVFTRSQSLELRRSCHFLKLLSCSGVYWKEVLLFFKELLCGYI